MVSPFFRPVDTPNTTRNVHHTDDHPKMPSFGGKGVELKPEKFPFIIVPARESLENGLQADPWEASRCPADLMEEKNTRTMNHRWLSLKNRAISMAESPGKSPGSINRIPYLLRDRFSPDPH